MKNIGIAAALMLSGLNLGCRSTGTGTSDPKILGGSIATSSSPFFAGLYLDSNKKSTFCGGSYIDKNVVLTAAHCVNDRQGIFKVAIGITNNEIKDPSKLIKVTGLVVHPDFDENNLTPNDIALLFLDPNNKIAPETQFIALNMRKLLIGPALFWDQIKPQFGLNSSLTNTQLQY